MKTPLISHRVIRGNLTGKKFIKNEKKLKSSRKALEITRGLTGDDCIHVYNHFLGLAHNCVGCC